MPWEATAANTMGLSLGIGNASQDKLLAQAKPLAAAAANVMGQS